MAVPEDCSLRIHECIQKGVRLMLAKKQDIKMRRLTAAPKWMAHLIAPWTAIIMTFSGIFLVADRSHLEPVLSTQGHVVVVEAPLSGNANESWGRCDYIFNGKRARSETSRWTLRLSFLQSINNFLWPVMGVVCHSAVLSVEPNTAAIKSVWVLYSLSYSL